MEKIEKAIVIVICIVLIYLMSIPLSVYIYKMFAEQGSYDISKLYGVGVLGAIPIASVVSVLLRPKILKYWNKSSEKK